VDGIEKFKEADTQEHCRAILLFLGKSSWQMSLKNFEPFLLNCKFGAAEDEEQTVRGPKKHQETTSAPNKSVAGDLLVSTWDAGDQRVKIEVRIKKNKKS
jgi:hypothetical protein